MKAATKRIRLAQRACTRGEFAAAWRDTMMAAATAPPDVRPLRIAACTVLDDVTPGTPHDAVGLEWFGDAAHLARYEAWSASPAGLAATTPPHRAVDPASERVVVAHEHVMRGEDWLRRRWADGAPSLRHMALARRAPGLTPAGFLDRWGNHAGSVGAVAIPPEARGLAYVQNRPVPRTEGEWPYDAVNEVYFDDMAGVRTRMDFFAGNPGGTGDGLVGESCFVVVREDVVSYISPG
ncbi:EthD domain-containing protein [Yinghuangia sp. ASG 101]|uniref:EthD domain-containing protein n=1 Tax=Yinghuangia sp. ASG 101 TaxID=2896848 RepID=UPI001E2FA927|nr:EthD domain-containing protein [Yinghuangia sp. ASG 101]UGQ12476.1 EthD domain-containing protein [Yinghuangia sp. ASG 101]